jgi:hypothetical protein
MTKIAAIRPHSGRERPKLQKGLKVALVSSCDSIDYAISPELKKLE